MIDASKIRDYRAQIGQALDVFGVRWTRQPQKVSLMAAIFVAENAD